MDYAMDRPIAIAASQSERAAFIRRTYAHLAGAILAFVGLEALLLNTLPGDRIREMMGSGGFAWLGVLALFFVVSWLANAWAHSETSTAIQYLGLGIYVVAEAIIFLPLLHYAVFRFRDPSVVPMAGILTLAVFGGLTLSVFMTRKDFSYLGPILSIGSMLCLGVIVIFCFVPGVQSHLMSLAFCFGVIALVSGYILYYTSNVLHHYRTTQHVAAALALFSSIATLFWYILRILILTRD